MEPWKTNLEPSKITGSWTGWLWGVQVVTGDSQEEVMIFRDKHTLHHNIYIVIIIIVIIIVIAPPNIVPSMISFKSFRWTLDKRVSKILILKGFRSPTPFPSSSYFRWSSVCLIIIVITIIIDNIIIITEFPLNDLHWSNRTALCGFLTAQRHASFLKDL